MPFTTLELLKGIAAPAVIAAFVGSLLPLLLRRASTARYSLPVAFVAGLLSGYWLLGLGPVVPKLDRDWTPYAAVAALPAALIPGRRWRTWSIKAAVLLLAIGLIGWWLVPSWPTLEPSREIHLLIWLIYAGGLSLAMLFLAFRLAEMFHPQQVFSEETESAATETPGGVIWLIMISGTLLAAFAMLPMTGSLRFAQIAGAAFGAMVGIVPVYWLAKRPPLDGIAIVYAPLISAIMLTAKVNSFSGTPTICYVLLPLAPLAIGLLGYFPRAKQSPWMKAAALILAIVIASIAVGIAAYVFFSESTGATY